MLGREEDSRLAIIYLFGKVCPKLYSVLIRNVVTFPKIYLETSPKHFLSQPFDVEQFEV